MACYHPLKAFIIGKNEDTGKNILKIKKYETQYIYEIDEDIGKYYSSEKSLCPVAESCSEKLCTYECLEENSEGYWDGSDLTSFKTLPMTGTITAVYKDFITIPCGQCIGCRIDKSREWANRMMLELPYSTSAYFVTLTYNDENLPRRLYRSQEYEDEWSGEILESYSLDKRDLQLFNKRLRKRYGNGIRFYAAGEYGSKSLRPHYHAIYFNLPLSDLVPFKRSSEGFMYYRSATLEKLWKKGFVMVTDVTWQTCAYVARYVTKKRTGKDSEFYNYFNIEPEFSIMSRKPGLGRMWFDEHGKDAYETYIISFSTKEGSIRFRPPGYFDSLYDIDHHDELEVIKENRRKMAENANRMRLTKTDKSYLELLEVQEFNFKHRIKTLVRSDV